MEVIKTGAKGEIVKILQDALKKQGYSIDVDGDFGLNTDKVVKEYQKFKGLDIDGIVGAKTWESLGVKTVEVVIDPKYLKFDWSAVIAWETGGKEYYEKYLKKFTYPGGASGCTIAVGIDCAYYSEFDLRSIFSFLPKKDIDLIVGARGKTGSAAKAYLPNLKHIEVSWPKALELFYQYILPKYYKYTVTTWPGTEKLKEKAQVALTSIIFNRGTSLEGDSRREMRVIKSLVPAAFYKEIAAQIRSMKRLWIGQGLDGLLKRREEEAVMVESV